MKEYTIDCLKWRCGSTAETTPEENTLGRGRTELLNEEGFMCCLGQCAEQSGVGGENLIGYHSLDQVDIEDREKILEPFLCNFGGFCGVENSNLSNLAMQINDDDKKNVEERIYFLRKLFKEHGLKIKFKNIRKAIKQLNNRKKSLLTNNGL